jgi:Zn-dependent protease with chaperone function
MEKVDSARACVAALMIGLALLFPFVLLHLYGYLTPGHLRPFLMGKPALLCLYRCLGLSPFLSFLGEAGKILLFSFLSCAFLLALLKTRGTIGRTRRFIKQVQQKAIPSSHCAGLKDVVIFEDKLPLAFTGGFLKPRIYLSRSLLNSLEEEEIRAIVLHESRHKKARDPLKSLFVSFLCDLYFFLPVAVFLKKGHRLLAEIRADAQEAEARIEPLDVARTLLKVRKIHGLSSSWFNDMLLERTKYLCGEKVPILPPMGRILISASLAALLVFFSLRPSPQGVSKSLALHQQSCPWHTLHK